MLGFTIAIAVSLFLLLLTWRSAIALQSLAEFVVDIQESKQWTETMTMQMYGESQSGRTNLVDWLAEGGHSLDDIGLSH